MVQPAALPEVRVAARGEQRLVRVDEQLRGLAARGLRGGNGFGERERAQRITRGEPATRPVEHDLRTREQGEVD